MVTSRRQRWLPRLAMAGILALATVNLLWQLGSSSLYVDEVQSAAAALEPLSKVVHAVGLTEVTPPAYFLFLHEWLYILGPGHLDWLARLPSALGGILLVAAIMWLASLVLRTRGAALFAGLLAACSPFVLEHAQRAQGYLFVALGATIAAAAALEATRRPRARGWWLTLSLTASLLSLAVHYTAALAIVPLAVWILTRPTIPRSWKLAYVGACLVLEAGLVPLLIDQHRSFPQRSGVAATAALTPSTLADMLEVPLGGRVSPLRVLGDVVMVAGVAIAAVWMVRTRRPGDPRTLIVATAILGPLVLIALSAAGGGAFWGHLMLTRYAACCAPFMMVSIASALEWLPIPAALLLAAAAIAIAVTASVESHRDSGFFFDARGVVAYLRANVRPGDVVVAPSSSAMAVPLIHYGLSELHPRYTGAPGLDALIAARKHRLWMVTSLSAGGMALTAVRDDARSDLPGYLPSRIRIFPATAPAAVLLEQPMLEP